MDDWIVRQQQQDLIRQQQIQQDLFQQQQVQQNLVQQQMQQNLIQQQVQQPDLLGQGRVQEDLARQQLERQRANEDIRISGLVSNYNPAYQSSPFDVPGSENRPQEELERQNQRLQDDLFRQRQAQDSLLQQQQQDGQRAREFLPGERDFMPPEHHLDMSGAPDRSARTAKGHKRDSRYFWKEMLRQHPELFSRKNRNSIEAGLRPEVDKQWLKHHPAHEAFKGDFLVHHHVDRGPMAVGIPRRFHEIFHGPLHYE